jgi:hypothetical protein
LSGVVPSMLRRMTASITGFIVGAIIAIVFYVVATALVVFAHSALVFGLIAILIWLALTFNWSGFRLRA